MSHKTLPRVLILATAAPDDRKTLCVIRSLGRAGYDVTIASDSFKGRSFHSRFLRRKILIPHPGRDEAQCLEAVRSLLAEGGFAAVLPTTDYMTFFVSRFLDVLPDSARLPVPGAAAAEICKDKLRTADLARRLGLPVPLTYCPANIEELKKLTGDLSYPCILKPRTTAGAVGLTIAATRQELLHAYASMPEDRTTIYDFRRPLVQERIAGTVHEVCALFNRGEPRALLSQKRMAMFPAEGGAGIYNETTDDPELKTLAVKLLRALNWHGPVQVEFIRDSLTGRNYLLEVNGRFWGTLDLSVAAGMDFPLLACRMAIDGDVETQFEHRIGLRFRWPYPFAILHAMETGQWVSDFWRFAWPHRSTRSDLAISDPMPLTMEVIYALRRLRSRGFRTMRSTGRWTDFLSLDSAPESGEN